MLGGRGSLDMCRRVHEVTPFVFLVAALDVQICRPQRTKSQNVGEYGRALFLTSRGLLLVYWDGLCGVWGVF